MFEIASSARWRPQARQHRRAERREASQYVDTAPQLLRKQAHQTA
jgi:hypothetical protein